MDTKMKLTEYLKLPAAKREIAQFCIAIVTLSTVIIYFQMVSIPAKEKEYKSGLANKDTIIASLRRDIQLQAQNCDEDKKELRDKYEAYIEKRLSTRESQMDKVIDRANEVIANQHQAKSNVRKSIRKGQKIVNENAN